jgi:hypothetical protein
MDLVCYLHPGWAPLLRPATPSRAWMDATPEAFAYRCLPLNIANAHGWEVLSSCGFEACWTGGSAPADVLIRWDQEGAVAHSPVALFGQGVLTFHVEGLIRTPPGWNLWVGGPPNALKDGLQPLTGVVETDWSPFTFTMNWRFTRPGHWVRFEEGEAFCFFFPVQRGVLETIEPRLAPLGDDPELAARFADWSRLRQGFHDKMRTTSEELRPSAKWQKHYYRGVDVSGARLIDDHESKLRLKPFDASATPGLPAEALARAAAWPSWMSAPQHSPGSGDLSAGEAESERLLEALERQRQLSPAVAGIERCSSIDGEAYLERYYASGRPVILTEEMQDWPDLSGASFDSGAAGLWPADQPRRLDEFVRRAGPGPWGDLHLDCAGARTPMRQARANRLFAQLSGRARFMLIPAAYTGRLLRFQRLHGKPPNLLGPDPDAARLSALGALHAYDVTLEPGEALYLPVGWWEQTLALDQGARLEVAQFHWPNPGLDDLPA